jgi:MoaA/NifB/PqqE/SkfB family radical SAM enzyme
VQIGISNWFRALAAGDAPPRLGSRRPLNIRFYTAYPTCNLSCSYCIAGHGDKYPKPQSQWDEQRFLAIVDNIRKLPYDVNIRLGVGGEFFVSKTLIDAARRLSHSGNVASVNLITNLTFSLKQYDRIFAGYRRDKVAVVASFHPTEIEDHEAWFDKAAGFHRRFDFAVVLVAFPDLLPDVPATKRKLEERGVQVFVQPYIGEHGGKSYPRDYSDEERALLRREMYSRHDYEFQVNLKRPGICHAGHRSIYVTPLGKVFPCGTGLYTEAFVLGDLSQSPDLRLRDSPAPCPFQACQCDTENVNTVDFETHYQRTGKNQHTYEYRFNDLAEQDERFAEWNVRY